MVGKGWRAFSRGVLVFTNVLFLALGTVLIILGAYMMSLPDLSEFSDGGLSGAILTCGILILLTALLGCCGAQWDNKVFLFPYGTLVAVSFLAQIILASFCFNIHGTLVRASAHSFNLAEMSDSDQKVLQWINHRFGDAYKECGLSIDLQHSMDSNDMAGTCANPKSAWFANFLHNNCHLTQSDLAPGADFMKCTGPDFSLSAPVTKHVMLCACESRMISWVNNQSLLIAVFLFTIAVFEIILVSLSCYVMCTRRPRRYGYQEIRMPTKSQEPYNPHARNFAKRDTDPRLPFPKATYYDTVPVSPTYRSTGSISMQIAERDENRKLMYGPPSM